MSYLDIARAYLRGDWTNALSTYWSPLYSWLIAASLSVARPRPGHVPLLMDALVFLGLAAGLAAWLWLTNEWERWQGPPNHPFLVDLCGFLVFASVSLYLVRSYDQTADMFSVPVFLTLGGLLIRAKAGRSSRIDPALFGATLAIGFLAKAAFIAAIPPFLLGFVATSPPIRRHRIWICVGVLLAGTAPFVIALSVQNRRFVFSDAGAVNYAVIESGLTIEGYKESAYPPPVGIPHKVRHLLEGPLVIGFDGHPVGTAPNHFNPAWWAAGYPWRFDARRQLASIRTGTIRLMRMTEVCTPLYLFLFCLTAERSRRCAVRLVRLWYLWVPCCILAAAYCLVYVANRYLAGAFALSGFTLIGSVWQCQLTRKAAIGAAVLVLAVGMRPLYPALVLPKRLLSSRYQKIGQGNVEFAKYLRAEGFRPGDRVGMIGSRYSVPWLALDEGQIIACIPVQGTEFNHPEPQLRYRDVDAFWKSPPATQEAVFQAFRSVGAKWAIAVMTPSWADTSAWKVGLGREDFGPAGRQRAYYVRRLAP